MNKFRAVVATLALALLALTILPVNDPALPEIVFDRDGVAWTQSGERIEEDSPLWDCEIMGNRICG